MTWNTLLKERLFSQAHMCIVKIGYERFMCTMSTIFVYPFEHMAHNGNHNADILSHNLPPFRPLKLDSSISCLHSQSGPDLFNTNWNADWGSLCVLCLIDNDKLLEILRKIIFK